MLPFASLFSSSDPDPVAIPVYWKYFSRPRVSAVSATEVTCPAGGSIVAVTAVSVTFGVEVPEDSHVPAVALYMSQTSWYPDRVAALPVTVSGVATVSVRVACAPGFTVAGSGVYTGVTGVETRVVPSLATQW